jgi:hypothetical protein
MTEGGSCARIYGEVSSEESLVVDWKLNLANYFEELRILQESKQETLDNFNQFCEFIAEPAFESLEEELKQYNIRTSIKRQRGRSMELHIFFPKSRIENLQYIIQLPKNSLELTLKLKIRGRKNRSRPYLESELPFMEKIASRDVLKMDITTLIQDVIEHYRHFNFEAFISPE